MCILLKTPNLISLTTAPAAQIYITSKHAAVFPTALVNVKLCV